MRKDPSLSSSPLNLASRARYDLLKWDNLTKKDLVEVGDRGNTFLHYIAIHGHWVRLPNELKKFSLTQPSIGGDKIIHLLAKNGRVSQIPKDLISKDLLKLPGAGKETVYHILAAEKYVDHIPQDMWDKEALTIKSESGLTPLHFIPHFSPWSLPHDITLKDLLLKTTAGHTPLHAWAMDDNWQDIPEKYLTSDTLMQVGRYDRTLLSILTDQYKNGWASRGGPLQLELTCKMRRIMENVGNRPLQILAKDPSPAINKLAKRELAKRKILKSVNDDCPLEV